MWKVSQLIGKSIVSGDNGEKLGRVADVMLHPAAHQVVGLVVAGGVLSPEQVLPYAEIQTLGTDAVIARSGTGLVTAEDLACPTGARDASERGEEAARSDGERTCNRRGA